MAGIDLKTVQELAGHKTIAMTLRYSHLAPSHLQEAVRKLEGGATHQNQVQIVTTTVTNGSPGLESDKKAYSQQHDKIAQYLLKGVWRNW